jgi:hypothetical protein
MINPTTTRSNVYNKRSKNEEEDEEDDCMIRIKPLDNMTRAEYQERSNVINYNTAFGISSDGDDMLFRS